MRFWVEGYIGEECRGRDKAFEVDKFCGNWAGGLTYGCEGV